MRIRYNIPFKKKIIIDDHWEIPVQGGKLRILEENGYAKAIELIFEKQPVHYAPFVQQHDSGEFAATISTRDHNMSFIKHQIDSAIAFVGCMYDFELATDEVEARYEAETIEEETQIKIKSFAVGHNDAALIMPFDIFTRAVMAAERNNGPRLESTLVGTARKALAKQEFINSFRYSFLLIESLYGEGHFKKAALQAVLKKNLKFRSIVEFAVKDVIPARNDRSSDTAKLLAANPTADSVIDHLIEKRGFYFHGNIQRKDAWRPDQQGAAESLALLAIGIVSAIAMNAADLLFSPEFEKRHFDDAMRAGAKIVLQIEFKFRMPEEDFDRSHQMNITTPGTKLTPRTAFMAAQEFLQLFKDNQPTSSLISAKCTMKESGHRVFEMVFNTSNDTQK